MLMTAERARKRPPYLDGKKKQLLIDGQWVDAISGETFKTFNPATGELLAEIALGDERDIDRAVAAARKAFNGPWSRFKPSERQAVMLKLADLIEAEFDDLAITDTMEMGHPIQRTSMGRSMITRVLRHYAGQATAIHGETIANSFPIDLMSYTLKEPVGVVGAIVPWNGPIFTAVWKIAPVLATGCTVVLKPSEEASITPLRFGELCLEAGVPPGVVNVVTGYGAGAGAALTTHPDVDKLTFTGSSATGQAIIRASASTVKRVTLELGGKSPNIIFADANLDLAIPASAAAIFNNSGQICSAGSRLYVERSIYDEVVAGVAAFGAKMRIGDTLDPETQLGPIVSEKQLQRVQSFLELGPREGATIAGDGGRRPADLGAGFENGHYLSPAVFANVRDEMRIAQEEIFGPVVCAMPFDGFDEVIARANATNFGLAGGVWTQDITRAHAAIRGIRAGSIWVNHYQAMDPSMPFGGYKMSGLGREGGSEHIDSYLNTKGVWIRTTP